ncbi:MAG: hypothetical protein L0211_14785 [Planctomycetaceae bacterium]|nr:hypothetical protein [Planctomycetaceae bacterium]
MTRRLGKALDRPLAILVALAVAWLPGGLRASCCGVASGCHQAARESCCSNGYESVCEPVPAGNACCHEARRAARDCRCEFRRSQPPAAALVRGDHSHSSPEIFAPTSSPAEPLVSDWLALRAADKLPGGPPLRVLYCVWRN